MLLRANFSTKFKFKDINSKDKNSVMKENNENFIYMTNILLLFC